MGSVRLGSTPSSPTESSKEGCWQRPSASEEVPKSSSVHPDNIQIYYHMKIIVTGGAGFIGSHLVDELIRQGYKDVHIIDNLSTGKRAHLNPKAKFHNLDITNISKIRPVFKKTDFVFHLAAQPRIQPSIKDPKTSHDNNATGTLHVLLCAKDAGVKKFIYSASSSAYGTQKTLPLKEDMVANPLNPYAMQKYMGELYCQLFTGLYGLPTVRLRYFNVYGPRQSTTGAYATVIGIFLKQKKARQPLTIVPDGKQRRDFTNVRDIVAANIAAMRSAKVGNAEVINIGSGENFSILEVADIIGGKTKTIAPRKGETKVTLADIKLAKRLLDWKPKVRFIKGVEELKNI